MDVRCKTKRPEHGAPVHQGFENMIHIIAGQPGVGVQKKQHLAPGGGGSPVLLVGATPSTGNDAGAEGSGDFTVRSVLPPSETRISASADVAAAMVRAICRASSMAGMITDR